MSTRSCWWGTWSRQGWLTHHTAYTPHTSYLVSLHFFFNLTFLNDSLGVLHHAPKFCSLHSPPISSPYPYLATPARNKRKQIKVSKQTKAKTITINPPNQTKTAMKEKSLSFSLLSPQHLFIHPGGNGGISFIGKCSLQWVAGLVQGIWFLLHHHHRLLTRTPLEIFHRTSPFTSSSRY